MDKQKMTAIWKGITGRLLWVLVQALLLAFFMLILIQVVHLRRGNAVIVGVFLLVVWSLSVAVNVAAVFSARRVSLHPGYVELESLKGTLKIPDSELEVRSFSGFHRVLIGSGVSVGSNSSGEAMMILRSFEGYRGIVHELLKRIQDDP